MARRHIYRASMRGDSSVARSAAALMTLAQLDMAVACEQIQACLSKPTCPPDVAWRDFNALASLPDADVLFREEVNVCGPVCRHVYRLVYRYGCSYMLVYRHMCIYVRMDTCLDIRTNMQVFLMHGCDAWPTVSRKNRHRGSFCSSPC